MDATRDRRRHLPALPVLTSDRHGSHQTHPWSPGSDIDATLKPSSDLVASAARLDNFRVLLRAAPHLDIHPALPIAVGEADNIDRAVGNSQTPNCAVFGHHETSDAVALKNSEGNPEPPVSPSPRVPLTTGESPLGPQSRQSRCHHRMLFQTVPGDLQRLLMLLRYWRAATGSNSLISIIRRMENLRPSRTPSHSDLLGPTKPPSPSAT